MDGFVTALHSYQTKLFGSDGRTPLVFEKKDGFPNSDQGETAFRRMKEQLREAARRASNFGEAILLEEGMTAKPIAVNAKENETTTAFTQQAQRICGLMDVPAHRLALLESVAYNNLSAINRQYVHDSLMPIVTNIEIKFRNHSLPMRDWPLHSVEFDRSALMSNDPDTLEKLIKVGMSTGVMTVNEARTSMPIKLNPIGEGGDDRTVPVNMALVKPDGTIRHAATGQNPTNPGAGEEESPDNNADKGLRLVGGTGAA